MFRLFAAQLLVKAIEAWARAITWRTDLRTRAGQPFGSEIEGFGFTERSPGDRAEFPPGSIITDFVSGCWVRPIDTSESLDCFSGMRFSPRSSRCVSTSRAQQPRVARMLFAESINAWPSCGARVPPSI